MSSDPISSGDEDKLELFYLFNDEASQDMSIALNLAAPTAFRLDDENRSTAGTRWPEYRRKPFCCSSQVAKYDVSTRRSIRKMMMITMR